MDKIKSLFIPTSGKYIRTELIRSPKSARPQLNKSLHKETFARFTKTRLAAFVVPCMSNANKSSILLHLWAKFGILIKEKLTDMHRLTLFNGKKYTYQQ
jgi:hypothetical protein